MISKTQKVWGHSKELRLLITQKCNFKCTFCHGEGYSIHNEQRSESLDIEDYGYLVKVCKDNFNWNTVTLSGGEPLLRKDINKIAERLYKDGLSIKLVTNGYLLSENLELGKYLKRVNISLNAMDDQFFKKLVQTKCDLQNQLDSIKHFSDKNKEVSIMLNSVLLSDTLREGVLDKMIQFSESVNGKLKFIEIYPETNKYFVPLEELENLLVSRGFSCIFSDYEKQVYSRDNVEVGLTRVLCATAAKLEKPGKHCNENSSLYVAPDGTINYCNMNEAGNENLYNEIKNRDEKGIVEKINIVMDKQGSYCGYVRK